MALKTLMLKRNINTKKAELEVLKQNDSVFLKREKELTVAVDEAVTEDEMTIVETEIEKYDEELKAHDELKKQLENDIDELEKKLSKEEEKIERAIKNNKSNINTERGIAQMNTRTKFFGMTMEQRDSFFASPDVKDFLQRTRELGIQKRAITGAELLIPTVVLDLIRENIENYSKLYKHLNVRSVSGKARQTVMGTIPEAVWTEMCAALNEMSIYFNGVEVDGYKVGGYIAVCNATLEDSDIQLASEIITVLGQSIGLGLDKAIVYGTGVKMPMGIVTRLAQTEDPQNSKTTIPWSDLHTSNILTIKDKTGIDLFKELIIATGAAKGKYSRGSKFWVMNEKTYTKLIAESVEINAAGAIVSGVKSEMPIVGGVIEVLNFMPDNVIVGGYGDLYLLAERAGAAIAQSDQVRFIEDQTVFRGTARYDGIPVIAEGFVAIGINGNTPTADAVTFPPDTANTGE